MEFDPDPLSTTPLGPAAAAPARGGHLGVVTPRRRAGGLGPAAGSAAAASPAWRRVQAVAWALFLVWTAVGYLVMPLGWGEAEAARWCAGHGLPWAAGTAGLVLRASDAVWMLVAAVVVFAGAVIETGVARAYVWLAVIVLGAGAAEWVGAQTGFPFGPYAYSDRLGWRVGGVLPFTIPMAWLVTLLGGRCLVRCGWPRIGGLPRAAAVGCLALLTDINLETIAWKERHYWRWYPAAEAPPAWPPWQNFVSWFAVAWLLTAVLPEPGRTPTPGPDPVRPGPPADGLRTPTRGWRAWSPAGVFLLMNGLFFLVHLARWLRRAG